LQILLVIVCQSCLPQANSGAPNSVPLYHFTSDVAKAMVPKPIFSKAFRGEITRGWRLVLG